MHLGRDAFYNHNPITENPFDGKEIRYFSDELLIIPV